MGLLKMLIHSLPAGGAFRAGEIEVSLVATVHKAALSSQMLLYQALQARLNENDIENFRNSRFPSEIQ